MRSVLIAGGGIAGIEALLALRDLAGERAEVTLVSEEPEFVFKPEWVEEPFGLGPAGRRELGPAVEEAGGSFILGAVSHVDAAGGKVILEDGAELSFDFCIVCLGGAFDPAYPDVVTFPGRELRAEELLTRASVSGGDILTFIVPPKAAWSLPLYELALMTQRLAADRGYSELKVKLVTPEEAPLALFGHEESRAVAELLEARKIEFCGSTVTQSPPSASVALPVLKGPFLAGLPTDEDGFIPVDSNGRVSGQECVYAAGDCTTFPVKQGGLATQQADAAATHLAHRLGVAVEPEPFQPVLRGKLLTGGESLSLRSDLASGGGGGEVSPDALWWPPRKVSGRYLSSWLERGTPEPKPPGSVIEVEVAVPGEWHQLPFAQAD